MSASVKELTSADFQSEVLEADVPVLVDFWAPWCGPCRMLAPVLEEIAKEYSGRVKVCKVNVDNNSSLASSYGIMSIPTMVVFNNGSKADRFSGYMSKTDLASKLDAIL